MNWVHTLDISIDLNGYTSSHRGAVFFNRVAPSQINFLGYPGTMGPNFMDYIVADGILIPDEHQVDYGEKIIYMPHCYQPNDRLRIAAKSEKNRSSYGLPDAKFVYCSFNEISKVNPTVFSVWMEILKLHQDSVFWILDGKGFARENLRKEASARNVDPARLIFADKTPEDEHFARLSLADLLLDTWPYNAHTTASEALWFGLPVLTKIGETFAGRVAASILTAAGLPQLIAKTDEEFIRLAVELANHPSKITALKKQLLDTRYQVPLFDIALYTRHLENAYEQIVDRQINGLAPEHIIVPTT